MMDTPLALLVFVPLLVAHLFYRLGFRAGCKEGRLQARDMVANYNQYLRSPTVRTLTRALYDFCDGREIDPERKAADAKQIVDDKLERRTKVEAFDAMDAASSQRESARRIERRLSRYDREDDDETTE